MPTASPLSPAERDELIKLRKQLKQVQMERDILAKATAWFAHHNVNTLEGSIHSLKQIRPAFRLRSYAAF